MVCNHRLLKCHVSHQKSNDLQSLRKFYGICLEIRLLRGFSEKEMRCLTLAGTFLLLLALLYVSWQFRFERYPDFPTYHLADLQSLARPSQGVEWLGTAAKPTLRLRVDAEHPRVVTRLDFPEPMAVSLLHLRFEVAAKHLRPGKQIWEDGRGLIEWHPPNGGPLWENDPFTSARHDQGLEVTERVMRPDRAPAIPALRFENLGRSGDLEITTFEATVLRERLQWKIGRWALLGGWLMWVIAFIGPRGKSGALRSGLAAAIWLVVAIYAVVPGPWKDIRSIGGPFQIGPEITSIPKTSGPGLKPATLNATSPQPVVLESVGKVSVQGDFTLKVKNYLPDARPLLHIAFFFCPTLLMAALVARKSAGWLAILLALAMEGAEFMFGFGFDWWDVLDLVYDAAGIALALAAFNYLKRNAPPRIARWLASAEG